jgi:hypothetical protein
MALLEIFKSKPKWMHSDAEVRAEAVRALPSEEQSVLATIARTDADAHVRRLALRRVKGVSVLAEIVGAEADPGVRDDAAATLLAALMGEGDETAHTSALAALSEAKHLVAAAKGARLEPVRRLALERLTDPKAIAAVAREAADAAQRLLALARLSEPSLRASVAQSSEHKDVALAALELIDDRGALKGIVARAKVKAVARRAKALLDARAAEPEPLPPGERHARLAQICRTLEGLVHSKDWGTVAEQVVSAEKAWAELAPCSGDEALTERYEAARRAVHAGLHKLEQEQSEKERQAETQRRAVAARLTLVSQAEALSGEDALARLDELRSAFTRLAPTDDPEAGALGKRFEAVCDALRVRVESGAAAAERELRRDALLTEAECLAVAEDLAAARTRLSAIEREWAALSAGRKEDETARFDAARARLAEREAAERAQRAEKEKANLERLSALARRLEKLAEAENLNFKDASRCLREGLSALADPGPLPTRRDRDALLARLEAARKKLYPRVQALKEDEDWKRWANVSLQEELCARIEALVDVQDLDEVARKVKEIDAQWKTTREVPREQGEALRERFRVPRETVGARLTAHFARLDAERAENLTRKEALCEQVEALAESTEWARTAEAIRKLQADWKGIGPAPRDGAEAIWRRFRKACDHFFTRFKQHRQSRVAEWAENLARKEALCARAEALAGSEDWDRAAAELRGLQDEWKKVGAVRRNKADLVWERFRKACDAFFERFKHKDEITATAALAERETVCRGIEELLPQEASDPAPPPADLAARVQAFQAAWRKPPRASEEALAPLAARFEQACLRLVELYPQSFAGSDLDPEAARKKLEKLCARVEAIVGECAPVAPAAGAGDLAERLRSALAANAMGGQAERETRWHAFKEEVEAARAAWRRVGLPPAGMAQPLAERFRVACDRFFALKPRGAREERRRADAR